MRFVTFQGDEVVGILSRDHIYYANSNKRREDNDYEYGRDILGGKNVDSPIDRVDAIY